MLKQLLLSGCVTGLVGLSLVQAAASQPPPKKLSASPSSLEASISAPISPPNLAELQGDLAQLSGKPVQLVQSVQVTPQFKAVTQPQRSKLAEPSESSSAQPLLIRVLVASDSANLSVATATDAAVLDANGAPLATLPQEVEYPIQPNSAGIAIGDKQFPTLVQIAPNADGLVYVNGHWYRGSLTLANVNGELLAVNSLDLEQYLYSVVGGEMPANWNSEALDAQAIAARSYAVAHLENPASNWYDLGSDESYQMYRGVESEALSTYEAVEATNGQVLAQNGRTLTALYASTDAVSNEAHAGMGMSQVGAQEMAQVGARCQEILDHYYPGEELYLLGSA